MEPKRSWKTLLFDNPRLLIMAIALICVAGLSSLQILPRMEDPTMTARNSVIFARYPGADSGRVEALVTDLIEESLHEIEEIHEIQSTSQDGLATLTLEIADEITDVDPIWTDVRDALDDVTPQLPEGVLGLELREFEISARTMIVGLSWVSEAPPEEALLARLGEELTDVLRQVPGTMEAKLFGAAQEEIRVEVDPASLASLGLDAGQVAGKIRESDAKLAAGNWQGAERELLIELQDEFDSLERIANVPVLEGPGGRVVRLGDLATVEKTVQSPSKSAARLSGQVGVAVGARMLEEVRVDLWSQDAREAVAEFARSLPPAIQLDVIFDQSEYTEHRLDTLFQNLFLGAGLVMIVVLLFMGWRSALLVGTALPLSVLMVFGGMRLLEIPLHQMSVAGLIIALGLLIDNAIVIVDELRRKLDRGLSPREALAKSVGILAVPLLGSTLTTTFAFAPLVLATGGVGEFVGSMSVSVILAVCSSFLLALTVVPALGALLQGKQRKVVEGEGARGLNPAQRAWRGVLGLVVAHPILGVLAALALPATGFALAGRLPEQFFPPADRDMVQIEVFLPDGTPLERTLERTAQLREVLMDDPMVRDVHWFAGASGPKFYYNQLESREDDSGYAAAIVKLATEERVSEWMRRAQHELDLALPSARVLVRLLEQGPPVDAPVEVLLKGTDLEALTAEGEVIRRELAASRGVLHTRASLQGAKPQLALELDEHEVELAGLTRAKVAQQLELALRGALGGSLVEDTEQLPVRVRLTAGSRQDLERLASLELALPASGAPTWTSLQSIGELHLQPATPRITRRDGVRTNVVQAWVEAGTLPALALSDLQDRLARSGYTPPEGISLSIGGESAERDDAVGKLAASTAILVILMAATLVLSFHSFRLAAVIGVVATASMGLAMGALFLFGYPFGFMAIVGTMGLMGVAINDSIVVLSALRAHPQAKAGQRAAVVDVVMESSRHVMATTVTTVVGFLPLFLGGGSFWPPVAVTIGGGVVGATFLALIFIPASYCLLIRQPETREEQQPELVAVPG